MFPLPISDGQQMKAMYMYVYHGWITSCVSFFSLLCFVLISQVNILDLQSKLTVYIPCTHILTLILQAVKFRSSKKKISTSILEKKKTIIDLQCIIFKSKPTGQIRVSKLVRDIYIDVYQVTQ